MARQSAQHLLASPPPHARRKIPLASSVPRQAFESSDVWSQPQLQNDGRAVPEKNSTRRRQTQDFRVALVTMTLTHCRTCAFRARFFYVAFHLGPWLKGFCAVA